ncbi:hypothetical protein [Streptomyces sp. HUAS ZL42]|uniref:hypothetical protein n=1 Tax=Streptomyces sp. HUAS ZL42 TaxID=3231715 RepID=UPI00345E6DD8
MRGTVAVQRGPIVYCAESVDLPGGHEPDAVRVDPSVEPEDAVDAKGAVVVAGELAAHGERGDAPWPYEPLDRRLTTTAADRAGIVLVSYRSWANRGPSTMRVWLPAAESERGNPTHGV